MARRNFNSDNEAGVAPEILAALARANEGMAHSYGKDAITERLVVRFCELFETDVELYPVVTGTAANALAVAQTTPPYGAIYCHEEAHLNTDECGAPEFYSAGAKLIGLPGARAKIDPAALAQRLRHARPLNEHECLPRALSISQATEYGAVYDRAEIATLARIAKEYDLAVHMDGARFANALVHAGCTPAELSWKAGIDLLSFGATKNGAMMAEALVIFDHTLARGLKRRRKRAGHLLSKMRFVSAQLEAYLHDGLWLRLARHANAAAAALAAGLDSVAGAALVHPVEANEVFVRLTPRLAAELHAAGFEFQRWSRTPDTYRMVTAFDTPMSAVEDLLETARRLAG